MIESALIENFRCFRHASLQGLKRMNVVVGSSSSGKTALLEALYLAASSHPNVLMKFRIWRGMGRSLQVQDSGQSFEGAWADLFNDRDIATPVSVQTIGTGRSSRTVKVRFAEAAATLPFADSLSDAPILRPLLLEWTDADGKVASAEIKIVGTDLALTASGQEPLRAAMLNSISLHDSPSEAANRLSQLSQRNQEQEILEPIQSVFRQIKGLSVEIVGGISTVCLSLEGKKFKQPVGLFSAGTSKLVSILLTIADVSGGVVLIDELENGLHYKTLGHVWSLVSAFAQRFNTQIFVSTHSAECLQALLPTLDGREADFTLIQCGQSKGLGDLRQSDGATMKAALMQDFELRF